MDTYRRVTHEIVAMGDAKNHIIRIEHNKIGSLDKYSTSQPFLSLI